VIEDFDRLTVTSLSRHYGRRKALSKVTFSCSSGDIAGLLGPNGAGKSTLLAILGTLLAPSEGGVRYGDVTAEAGGAGLRARIGMLGHDLFLSRGMRQRVALERALLHQPRLLLLDEPFTGLDQASTAALVARLKEEQGRGVLTVLATHDLDVVDGLLTRELFLRNGRLMEVGVGEGSLRERYRAAIATA